MKPFQWLATCSVVAVMFVLFIGCGPTTISDDDDATASPSPSSSPAASPSPSPAAVMYDFRFQTTDPFVPHTGQMAGVRVLDSQGVEVGCANDQMVPVDYTIAGILLEGETFTVEFWADNDASGGGTYSGGDHAWSYPVGDYAQLGSVAANVEILNVPHTGVETITWTPATGCP